MARLFHVTSVLNRASITAHGLDWTRMGAAPGIAGSREPEVDGVFVCVSRFEVDFFVGMNNTGGPVDVWAVDAVDAKQFVETDGFRYLPARIPSNQLTLVHRSLAPPVVDFADSEAGDAYESSLSITLDDGTVLVDDEAHEFVRREHDTHHGAAAPPG